MSMSKKDFIALADVVKGLEPEFQSSAGSRYDWVIMRDRIAAFCAAQNPAFNRERWFAYIAGECGPNGGKVEKKECKVHNTEGKIYVAYCTCGARNPHRHA